MELINDFKNLAEDKVYIQSVKDIIMSERLKEKTEDYFTIVPGIKAGKQVAAMKGFEYVTVKSQGCGGEGISPTFPAFSQFWEPQLQEIKINYCYDDFMGKYTQWALNNGYDIKNLEGTELGLFIEDLIAEAVSIDMLRNVLMSDKDIATQDLLSDPAKVKFYNTIPKGLIPTLQYLKGKPEFAENFIALEKNTGTSAEQQTLDKDYAVNLYEELTDVIDFDGDTLLSSGRLAKNYTDWLKRGNGFGVESNKVDTAKGIKNPEVDGNSLKSIKNYDRWRKRDFQKGTPLTTHLPHFAIYTNKDYLQVGVDDVNSLSDLRLEYIGGKEETFWIKGNYMLDFKMVNPFDFKAAL